MSRIVPLLHMGSRASITRVPTTLLFTNQPSNIPDEAQLRFIQLLLGDQQAQEYLEALGIHRLVLAIDANIMIQDVARYCRTREPTGWLVALRSPLAVITMSVEDTQEVYLHLERVSKGNHAHLAEMRHLWRTEYLPFIKTIDVRSVPLDARGKRLQQRDADDLALAQTSRVLGADHLLTLDPHLEEYAVPEPQWTQLAAAVRMSVTQQGTLLRITTLHLTVTLTVSVAVQVAWELLRTALRFAQLIFRHVPPVVIVLVLIAVYVLLSQPRNRTKLERLWVLTGPYISKALIEWVGGYFTQQSEAIRASRADLLPAQRFLEDKRARKLIDKTARGFAAFTLVRFSQPVPLEALVKAMKKNGYRSRSKHPERYVRRVLRKYAEVFVSSDDGWMIRTSVSLSASN
jgi:predicted nucleic acid-binding protein